MSAAGVETVVDSGSLAVVGLLEVVRHIPRIHREFRKLVDAAEREKPELAILTDSPDFHLRLAKRLKRLGVPVVYFVAPQAWAWRKGRVGVMRRVIDRLLCIFPFEEDFFRGHGIPATYIGHPLSRLMRPSASKEEFFARHALAPGLPVVALLPGSRRGEAARHMPALLDAAERIARERPVNLVLGVPGGRFAGWSDFKERISAASIQVLEGKTWDLLAHAAVALAASGTVTIEAALLQTPMVTFYKVTAASWFVGKFLVDVPFYSMVNLVAGKKVVPELMQNEMRGERLAAEALRLLNDPAVRSEMRRDLQKVSARLSTDENPIERAAGIIQEILATGH